MATPSRSDIQTELRTRVERELARRRAGTDPIAFAKLARMDPDPWQAAALQAPHRLLLNCCRQSGKSTTAAAVALHRALHRPGALVLLISPSLRQSGELLRKVSAHIRGLGGVKLRNRSALTLEFENGSRIVSLPASEDTIRGFSAVSLIVEDEAAFVPDELHEAVKPMLLVSGGDLILMSTPNGRRGHFFEAWESGGQEWTRIRVTAAECPRIPSQELEAARDDLYRRGLGEFFRQEYEGAFIDAAGGRVYSGFDEQRNVLEALPEPSPAFPWRFGVGLDFGIRDENGIVVAAVRKHDRTLYIVRGYRFHGGVREVGDEVLRLDEEYGLADFVGDTGGMGKAFQDDMLRYRNIPVQAASKTDKLGHIFLMNGALGDGRVMLVRGGTEQLREEWRNLAWAEGGKREAEGTPNHASDAGLYLWHYMSPHDERDATVAVRRTREEQIQEDMRQVWAETEAEIRREREAQREEERW